jgi:triosephosphate isomerase
VILGHSERRQYHGETDALVNEKIKLALANDLEVIYCCGELLEEREAGKAVEVVNTQIKAAFAGIPASDLAKITIAYEPVWAIGTGKTATPEDANSMHKEIRKTIADLYSKDEADAIIIQYGGSVKPANAKDLLNMEDIDGALVGGASLKAELFGPIAKFNK